VIDYGLNPGIRRRRDMNAVGKRILLAVALSLLAACASKKEASRPSPPRVEVVQARLAANQEFVSVQFRMIGGDRFDPETEEIYLVDEVTGERFPVVRLQRIGRLAEFSAPGGKDVHFVMVRNLEGKLKPGSRVTVVVGAARQEQLLLQ
jgi:hypothetical protein